MDAVVKTLVRITENTVETVAVFIVIVNEDILTSIPPKDYVVNCPRRMYARFSCHGKRVSPIIKLSSPDPNGAPLI